MLPLTSNAGDQPDALDGVIDRFKLRVATEAGEPAFVSALEPFFAPFRDKQIPFELRKAELYRAFAILGLGAIPTEQMGSQH